MFSISDWIGSSVHVDNII